MTSAITEEAKKIIAEAPESGPLNDPKAYADRLPEPAAGLAAALRSTEIVELSKVYVNADAHAMRAQKGFNWVALGAACSGFLATLVGGLLFFARSDAALATVLSALWAVQFVLLAVCLIGLLVLWLWQPFRAWRKRRSEAEEARVHFFSKLVTSPGQAADALSLALKLECLQRHLFEDQMRWFKKRGEEKRREALRWRRLSWIAVGITALGSIPQAVGYLHALDQPGTFFDMLGWLATRLPGDKRIYGFAWLIGSQVAALVAVIRMMYRSADLAKLYRREFRFLKWYLPQLAGAREAAAAGQTGPVITYVHTVTTRLAESVESWAAQDEGLGFP